MPKTRDSQSEIRELTQTFAEQLEALVRRSTVERIVATLGGQLSTPARRKPGRPAGSTQKSAGVRIAKAPKGRRRTADDVERMGESLLTYVKQHPDQRADQIAKALRTDVGTMRLPMKALIKRRKVKTKGQRRGTTYRAV